jgi:hypothetical protein
VMNGIGGQCQNCRNAGNAQERIGATDIAKRLGVGRRSVYRILDGQAV